MRHEFIAQLTELAGQDRRIVLLCGDVGYNVLEGFRARFPDRFVNTGVAEQNLIALATGMAEAGLLPFVYSMAAFITLRACEFLRNGPDAQRLPVRVIGVGGGLDYGTAGFTHHSLEDLALMRTMPNFIVVTPADRSHACASLRCLWETPEPVYFRLSKDQGPDLQELGNRFQLGRLSVLRKGRQVAFIGLGPMVSNCLEAAALLQDQGVVATVVAISTLQPQPLQDLLQLLSSHALAVTVENHRAAGGLGSLTAEIIAGHALPCRLMPCAVYAPLPPVGTKDELEFSSNLHPRGLADRVALALMDELSPD